jgi:hypothetical protein
LDAATVTVPALALFDGEGDLWPVARVAGFTDLLATYFMRKSVKQYLIAAVDTIILALSIDFQSRVYSNNAEILAMAKTFFIFLNV